MKLNQKLERLCAAKGWGQSNLLDAVPDISKSSMSNWFKGKHRPDLESARKIARALGVPLDYLADDAQDEPPAAEFSEGERAVIEFVRLMGLDKGEAIRRLATAPLVPARRVGEADPEPLSDEQFARKYPPPGPYIPPGAPEWPPAKPRKKRPG